MTIIGYVSLSSVLINFSTTRFYQPHSSSRHIYLSFRHFGSNWGIGNFQYSCRTVKLIKMHLKNYCSIFILVNFENLTRPTCNHKLSTAFLSNILITILSVETSKLFNETVGLKTLIKIIIKK